MKAKEIEDFFRRREVALGPEEGFRFGDPEVEVSGILVSWMATLEAIRTAIEEECNLMLVHEDLFYPYDFQRRNFERYLTWKVNRLRLKLLAENDITVFRAHGSLDRLCILDDFARAIGLPEPRVKEDFVRIYEIPEISLGELALRVKRSLGLREIRIVGPSERTVRRIGLPWGGLGLSINVSFLESLLKHRPDALIAGETDEYAMFFALDAGISLIETGHSVSENIGLRNFAEILKREFPKMKIAFFECKRPWTII